MPRSGRVFVKGHSGGGEVVVRGTAAKTDADEKIRGSIGDRIDNSKRFGSILVTQTHKTFVLYHRSRKEVRLAIMLRDGYCCCRDCDDGT